MPAAEQPGDPFRFQPEPAPPPGNPALNWGLRIAALVAIAVISGLVWSYVSGDDDPSGTATPTTQQTRPKTEGVYRFEPYKDVPTPRTDTDCAAHAYSKTKTFLAQPGICTKVVQAVFTTRVQDRTVLVGVGVLHMSGADKADELRRLTDQDGTGNVSDLVREGVVSAPPLKSLSNGLGYAAQQNQAVVVIVEADFAPVNGKSTTTKADEATLDSICDDALRLVEEIDTGA
ncbi:hypothetical protein UO65_1846 [Actinokineospora spheciospongiae]|uniref:Uncharacterized protein n=1 Tax=Actinokineospora spheciospongiae TaxID=909613 RepID=W7J198_9PSEU|nr:hypothetical protein UO65_1846 [Actinokineospora spheciospongiae]